MAALLQGNSYRLFSQPSALFLVAKRPNIGCDGLHIGLRQLRAAHWRHGAPIFRRLRDPFRNGSLNSREAAIAREPLPRGEIRADGRALAV